MTSATTTDCLTATYLPTSFSNTMLSTSTQTTTLEAAETSSTGLSLLERQRAKISTAAVAPTPQPHAELLGRIATLFSHFDYRLAASLHSEGKVSDDNYVLYTIEQLLAQLESKGFAIGKLNQALYLYNGAFFKELQEDEIRDMIQEAALAFGMPANKAKLVKFKDAAHLQLRDLARKIDNNTRGGAVKINALNGTVTINAATGDATLGPFSAADGMFYQLAYGYDPTAEATEWSKFLREVQPDEDVRKVLAEWQGYVFLPTARLPLEKIMLFHGNGQNGKGVVYEVVKAMYGRENVRENSLENLTTSEYHRVMLAGCLLNFGTDISRRLNPDVFKIISSGEAVPARNPYGRPFILENYAKLQFSCNKRPDMTDYSDGFRRRFIHMPFAVKIEDENKDVHLKQRLIANELPGILNWAIEGLKRVLKQEGFTFSQVLEDAGKDYHASGDVIVRFLNTPGEGYEVDKTAVSRVAGNDMFSEFQNFLIDGKERSGENISKQAFYTRLEELGFKRGKRGGKGQQFYATKRPDQD
jgi:putative DNA primase/helicase